MTKPTTEVDLSGFGLERLQHIGRGQYASAQLVKETATNLTYVAKCISLAALNDHDQDLAHQEVFLLQTLCNPYIVAYRDSFLIEGANTLVIVMEYCEGGDMRKAIKDKAKTGGHFPEEQVMTWFVQLCLALQYIHSEKVLHRDLKTSNIFLTEGGSSIKLGDFGISRVLEGTTEAAVTIVGTPYYMSPEVCRSEPYNWKSDIWALGCVLYELCMLKHAFESSSLLGLVYKIVSDHYEPIPSFYSPQLNSLINQLLMKSAESRPSINELFANPYVKAYLARQSMPAAMPTPSEPSRRAPTLRPATFSGPKPIVAKETPMAPGPPPLGQESHVLILLSRIRRRIIGQRLSWISSCASFDEDGDGALTQEAMRNALTTMALGLSEAEMLELTSALAPNPGDKISLDAFSSCLKDVDPAILNSESWLRQLLASTGRRLRDQLRARDTQSRGTLEQEVFKSTLKELLPVVTPTQLDLLVVMADKNGLGDVDYGEFMNTFGPPAPPPATAPQTSPAGPAAPPGMPPLPGTGAPAKPPGMPPLPGASVPFAPALDFGSTLNVGDISLDRTFFTCTSRDFQGHSSAAVVSLSPQGCGLIFSRLRRRLDAAGLALGDALALFVNPGDKEILAEQWLDVASCLPLGTSRAEMQQLFTKVDVEGNGRVPLALLETSVSRASTSTCEVAPAWISAAIQIGLGNRISEELNKRASVSENGLSLARESDFRRAVMLSERYLTADQLSSLLLLADKSPSGLIDYQEFAERFGRQRAPLKAPGGTAVPRAPSGQAQKGPSNPEEIRAVGARTAAVLERHGMAPQHLPSLLRLWGQGELPNDVSASLLASLPLGLSMQEAEEQLQASDSVSNFAAFLQELRINAVWKSKCEWAASNIPGPALRAVLQRQVIEAESRTLEPADFARALSDAGLPAAKTESVMWLAEKTAQGDVRIAEFLASFGGPAAQEKKKRGMLWRMMGR